MKLLVFILSQPEKLDHLLKRLGEEHLTGATVFNSAGMASSLVSSNDETLSNIFGSLRQLLKDTKKENKTLMMVTSEKNVSRVEEIIEEVVGNLDEPNTGILFTMPLDYVRGFKHK